MANEKIPQLVLDYWNNACTPRNVRVHCCMVGYVTHYLLQQFEQAGHDVDIEMGFVAGLLHDTYRVINFPNVEGIHHTEKDKHCLPLWQEQIKKYAHIAHEDFMGEVLERDGHTSLAKIVRMHQNENITELLQHADRLEEKCVYYADKRVAHARIVSFDERVEEARTRYNWTEEEIAEFSPTWDQVKELEKQLFSMLPCEPQELMLLNESIEIPQDLYG